MGGGVIPIGHQTIRYFFLLFYVCPKTWRFRNDEGLLASQGFCDPCISVCFSTYYIFMVGYSKGGG